MKKYTTPQIKISVFDEEITATQSPLSAPTYGMELENYIKNKKSVQRNFNFEKAIEFN